MSPFLISSLLLAKRSCSPYLLWLVFWVTNLLVSVVVGALGVRLAAILADDVETLPGPLVCALFVVIGGPLDRAEYKVVVLLDNRFDGSIIIDGGVLTFGLLGILVLLFDSCDLLVAVPDFRIVGKECSPSRGRDTRWTIHALVVSHRYVIDSLVDGSLIVL